MPVSTRFCEVVPRLMVTDSARVVPAIAKMPTIANKPCLILILVPPRIWPQSLLDSDVDRLSTAIRMRLVHARAHCFALIIQELVRLGGPEGTGLLRSVRKTLPLNEADSLYFIV